MENVSWKFEGEESEARRACVLLGHVDEEDQDKLPEPDHVLPAWRVIGEALGQILEPGVDATGRKELPLIDDFLEP